MVYPKKLPLAALAALFASITPVFPQSFTVVPEHADARVGAVDVVVSLDDPDWTYELGVPAKFRVEVRADGHPLKDVTVRYRLGPEMHEAEEVSAVVPEGGLIIEADAMEVPGVMRCSVIAEFDGRTYRSLASAVYAPLEIQPTQVDPEDFDAFWDAGKAELAKIAMAPQVTLLPERCTPDVNVYHVSYMTWSYGRPSRMYGILTEPKAPGSYPVALRVPGAGVRPYNGQPWISEKGVIVLEIGIHGMPVTLPTELYDNMRSSSLDYYPLFNLDSRERYYYRRVYLGCVRALDFLTSRENWNQKDVVVYGGSQGGQLSIVTGALDSRVTGVVADYPAYSDVTGYLHGRAGGWPHSLKDEFHQTEAKIKTTSYYDTVNFARRLKVPVSLGWGYNDEVCPVTSLYAVWNSINAPKSLVLDLDMGHGSSREFSQRFNERVWEMANVEWQDADSE